MTKQELRTMLNDLIIDCNRVVGSWERGNLAQAVNALHERADLIAECLEEDTDKPIQVISSGGIVTDVYGPAGEIYELWTDVDDCTVNAGDELRSLNDVQFVVDVKEFDTNSA